jgi:hypothetical protein
MHSSGEFCVLIQFNDGCVMRTDRLDWLAASRTCATYREAVNHIGMTVWRPGLADIPAGVPSCRDRVSPCPVLPVGAVRHMVMN